MTWQNMNTFETYKTMNTDISMAYWSNLHYRIKQKKHNDVKATLEETRKRFLLDICFHYSLVSIVKKHQRQLRSTIYLCYSISFTMIQEKLESCQDTVAKLLVFHPAKEGKSQQENPYTNNYLSCETLLQNILSISKNTQTCCCKR